MSRLTLCLILACSAACQTSVSDPYHPQSGDQASAEEEGHELAGSSSSASDGGPLRAAGDAAVAQELGAQGSAPGQPMDNSPLPPSMKGYELYIWNESNELAFALMTGTNRRKTAAEVLAAKASVSADGMVVVRGSGSPALRSTLQRVPKDTEILPQTLPELPPIDAKLRAEVAAAIAESR